MDWCGREPIPDGSGCACSICSADARRPREPRATHGVTRTPGGPATQMARPAMRCPNLVVSTPRLSPGNARQPPRYAARYPTDGPRALAGALQPAAVAVPEGSARCTLCRRGAHTPPPRHLLAAVRARVVVRPYSAPPAVPFGNAGVVGERSVRTNAKTSRPHGQPVPAAVRTRSLCGD